MNTLTTEEQLDEAVRRLMACCDGARSTDGAGFNKYDADFIQNIFPKRPWTPNMLSAVWKCLQKYHGQLSVMGIDIKAIPQPVPSAPAMPVDVSAPAFGTPAPTGVTIEVLAGGTISVRFPYNPSTVELIRQVPSRTWDGLNKQWLIQPEPLALDGLVRFAEQVGVRLPLAMQDAIVMGKEAQAKALAEAKVAMQDSMATDADFQVDDLGGVLMPFQRAGVKYACERKRVIIADEMGLGKTVQALATVKHLDAFPCLVICPASLKTNWRRETEKWIKRSTPTFYDKSRFGQVCIINYDIAAKWSEDIISRGKFKSLILDEAHYLKNHKAQRSVAVRHIAQAITKTQGAEAVVLALTGTPILNRPAELLHLLQTIGRLEDVGGFKNFRDRYLAGSFGGYGQHLEELQQICRSRFLIRREKSQVLLDLPAKRRVTVDIEMTDPSAYTKIENSDLIDNPAAAIVRIGELRRSSAHEKIEGVIKWVSDFLETDKKLILFSVHREVQVALMKAFPGSAHVLGEDTMAERSTNVDRFQEDPECRLIICSLKSAGVGLTLTASSDVAFHEFGWTPGDMDQAEDRAHRIGQRDSVTCWYLKAVGASIDEMMLDLIAEKREAGDQLLNAERTKDADQEKVKDRLVTAILNQARQRGHIVKGVL